MTRLRLAGQIAGAEITKIILLKATMAAAIK